MLVMDLWPILLMVPVAAVVGIIARNVRKSTLRSVLREHHAETGSPAAEIERIRAADRAEARALYERVTRDKLEVIKTALAMGYTRQDLQDLDARLEELIGSDKLHNLLEGDEHTAPSVAGEILDADLVRQLETLHPRKEKQ